MKAIILAAGRGSRMGHITEKKPKCLVEFRGLSLLERQLNALHSAGITEIGVVTGYKPEMLSERGLSTFHNLRWNETNMVSSLACAAQWLQEAPTIISYSDIFYDTAAVALLINSDADLAVTYDPNWLSQWSIRFDNPLDDAETFRLSDQNQIIDIGNKPKTIKEIDGQYMGLLRLTPRSWQEFEKIRFQLDDRERDELDMTSMLQKIIWNAKIQIKALAFNGSWGEIDSHKDLLAFEQRAE